MKTKRRLLSFLLTIVMLVGMMPMTTLATSEITEVELTITEPAIGANLDFSADVDGASPYTVTGVDWTTRWDAYYVRHNESTIVETGQPYTVYIYLEPKEGYSFAADTDDIAVTINGSSVGITKDLERTRLTCMLTYEELGYTISFDANGGIGTMAGTKVYDDYTLPACGFTAPEGKAFIGWAINSAEGTWYYPGTKLEVNADMRLYAKWTEATGTAHTLTFVNDAFDPPQTETILVNHGTYTLPECLFETATGCRFGGWWVDTNDDGRDEVLNSGEEIFVAGDMEIYVKWDPIVYRTVRNAEFKATVAGEYKHGMLAGSVSVALENDDTLPICMVSGGYGHGYWISSDEMLLGSDALSTLEGYKLYVRFKEDDDCSDALICDSSTFKVTGDFGNITPWRNAKVLPDGTYILEFDLPAVPGTELSTENITFTLNGYEADEMITAITAGVDTPHVSLRGSGYGSGLDAKSYMIWKDYYDYGYGVSDGSATFEKSRTYYLEINYALDEGYSFPASFWDGDELKKDKFKLSGFDDAEVYQVSQNSIVFRLPQLGNTVIENVEFILNGYEEGEASGNVTVTILDKVLFPRDDLDYFFYDESVGFSPEGAMSPIPATVFENGERYYIAMLIAPEDGYDASELEMEDFTIHTPYGSCTATGYGRATAFRYNEYYYVGFELPVINNASFTTYTVSFDADGGTGTMSDEAGVFGEYTLPANGFTAPTGKQFKAWSVGGSEKAVGEKITVTADTTVTAVWETVSDYTKLGDIAAVKATASIDPVLGAKTNAISFTITDPTDAAAKGIIISGTSWYKKDASSIYGWTQCSNGVDTFEEGTYRLSVQLRSKSNDDKEYYAMSGDTTFTVNGVQWNSEEPFRDYYASDGYGYRFFVSPEFALGGKTLDSIAVTTPPTKTVYREGEDFNPDGMVVTATYSDSTTAPVLLYTVTDGTDMAAGKTTVTISYTEGGVTKTTTQAITVAKEYTVTVEGGTGNGKYMAGEEVTISAFVSGGMQFKEWQGTDGLTFTSGDKNSQTATFTMPAHDVTVTAVTGPAEYYVSVSGGSGTGMYEAGETVTIVADTPEAGKQFKEWIVGDGKVLRFTESDITSSTAKFVMPGEAVRIAATYEDIPHTHVYDKEVANDTYKATEATCTAKATYYKSCACGAKGTETFAYGELAAHTEGTVWTSDATHHWHVCTATGCGAVIEGSKVAHTPDHEGGATEEYAIKCSVCDYEMEAQLSHTHVFDKEVANDTYKATEASCMAKATYYKSCACGAKGTETFAYGELAAHTEGTVWASDATHHWHVCTATGCGAVIEESKTAHTPDHEGGATEEYAIKCSVCDYEMEAQLSHTHVFDKEVANDTYKASEASCTAKATYYKSCACGAKGTETFAYGEFAAHTEGTVWTSDATHHWHVCTATGCGAVIEGSKTAHTPDHEGGATEEYAIKCSVCNYEMEAQLSHTHVFDKEVANDTYKASEASCMAKATYYKSCACGAKGTETFAYGELAAHTEGTVWTSDATHHWHVCTATGCGAVIEGSKVAHTPDHEGGATEEYAIKCSVCDYEMEAQLSHTHVFDKEVANDTYKASEATCMAKATYYKSCACGAKGTETFAYGEMAAHTEGSTWLSDATHHWHVCTATGCGAVIEGSKVAHSFEWVIDREATQTQAGSKHEECKGCGYKKATVEIPATGVPTPPEATATPTAPAESVVVSSPKTGDDRSLLWIALLLMSGLGATTTTIIRKKEKVGKE